MPVRENGRFIEPMLLLRTDALPNDADRWEYQLKLDGYRAIAFKTAGKLHLRSRNNNDFSLRYSGVVKGLAKLDERQSPATLEVHRAVRGEDGAGCPTRMTLWTVA